MLGKLYVHVTDAQRFLLVQQTNCFPHASFGSAKWRTVTTEADAPTDAQAQILRQRGFVQYRISA